MTHSNCTRGGCRAPPLFTGRVHDVPLAIDLRGVWVVDRRFTDFRLRRHSRIEPGERSAAVVADEMLDGAAECGVVGLDEHVQPCTVPPQARCGNVRAGDADQLRRGELAPRTLDGGRDRMEDVPPLEQAAADRTEHVPLPTVEDGAGVLGVLQHLGLQDGSLSTEESQASHGTIMAHVNGRCVSCPSSSSLAPRDPNGLRIAVQEVVDRLDALHGRRVIHVADLVQPCAEPAPGPHSLLPEPRLDDAE